MNSNSTTLRSQPNPPVDGTNRRSHNISWSPPPRDTHKINVDAHLSSDGRWFSGLLLRRSDGSAVGAATRSHGISDDAKMGEAWGLNAAIDLAESYNLNKVILEMDAQVLVNVVKKKMKVRKGWSFAIERCIRFLTENPNSSINWVRRDCNRAAHELAKWAELDPNKDWPNSGPSCISYYVQKDIVSCFDG